MYHIAYLIDLHAHLEQTQFYCWEVNHNSDISQKLFLVKNSSYRKLFQVRFVHPHETWVCRVTFLYHDLLLRKLVISEFNVK